MTVTRSDGSEYIRLVGIDTRLGPELEAALDDVLTDLAEIAGSTQRAEQSLLALLSERLLPADGSSEGLEPTVRNVDGQPLAAERSKPAVSGVAEAGRRAAVAEREALVRHICGISGGKDSSALAVYMRDRVPEMEYFFCDTGAELPETYEYLTRLEVILGKPITRLNASRGASITGSRFFVELCPRRRCAGAPRT